MKDLNSIPETGLHVSRWFAWLRFWGLGLKLGFVYLQPLVQGSPQNALACLPLTSQMNSRVQLFKKNMFSMRG